MKHLATACLLATLALFPIAAQADWTENFDSYALGSGLHGQGGWEGWQGDPQWNAYVSNVQARSMPHSVEITGNSDIVHPYTGYTAGRWVYTAWQYIPASFVGTTYFILLNTYSAGQNWSIQVSFANGMVTNDGVSGGTLPVAFDRWVEIQVVIDLDADTQTFYYDGQMLYMGTWTNEVSTGGALNIGAVDLYANGASPVYYDDMSLLPEGAVPNAESSWGSVKGLFR